MNTTTNQSAITIITLTIAVMAFSCVASICTLSFYGIQIPPELNTLAGGLVGALTAMLVKTSPTETMKQPPPPPPPATNDNPQPVKVVNPPDAPVPTEEQPK